MEANPYRETIEEQVSAWRREAAEHADPASAIRASAAAATGLVRLGQPEVALREVVAVIERHAGASDREVRGALRRANAVRARALRALGRLEDAAAADAEVARFPGEGVPPAHSDEELASLCARAEDLLEELKTWDAFEVLDQAVGPYALDLPAPEHAPAVLDAMLLFAKAAAQLRDLGAVIDIYEDIVRRYEPTHNAAIRTHVETAMWNWAFYVEFSGDAEQAEQIRARRERYLAD